MQTTKTSLYQAIIEPPRGIFDLNFCESWPYHELLFFLVWRDIKARYRQTMLDVLSAILQPTYGFVTNVYAYGKKYLRKGDILDGIGGYAAYGLIENIADNKSHPRLSICLENEVMLNRDFKKVEKIFMDDISRNETSAKFEIYQSELEA